MMYENPTVRLVNDTMAKFKAELRERDLNVLRAFIYLGLHVQGEIETARDDNDE